MKKYTMETAVGVFVDRASVRGVPDREARQRPHPRRRSVPVLARFTSVSGLRAGSSVNMFGIEVGRVEQLGMDQQGQQAKVEMLIRKDIKIYEDAIASIKTEGLIGDKYISIDPGGMGDPLKPGDTIIQTQPAVDVGDLIGKYAFGDVKKEEPEKK